MIITTCGNNEKLAKTLARKTKSKYSQLTISSFPDGDIYLKFNTDLIHKKLVIVQSFYPKPDQSLFDIIWAAETAKDLGAAKVILVAPYLGYMRQDIRFHPGEAISSRIMAKLLNSCIDKIITFDPHLHRYRSLKEIFTIPAKRLTANPLIANHLKGKSNLCILGPDWESYQWAEAIARKIKAPVTVLEKTRFSSKHVHVKMKNDVDIKGKHVVIVDDIISTGHTIIEAAKKAKKKGAKKITAIGVHGIFVDNAIKKLQRHVDQVITTNTIEHPTNKIDITNSLAKLL